MIAPPKKVTKPRIPIPVPIAPRTFRTRSRLLEELPPSPEVGVADAPVGESVMVM
jgi:hypothetical protein